MKVMICEGTPKEIADLFKDLEGQPELTIDSKAVAKAVQKAIHDTAVKERRVVRGGKDV